MRHFVLIALCFLLEFPVSAKKKAVYGVGFYNLENLFDTQNTNGKYDLEYSPLGSKKWNEDKYTNKLNNMAYALAELGLETTPHGVALVGVSEVENRGVLEDLVQTSPLKERGWKVVHYDSPDKRGIDVGLLYNPKQFRVLAHKSHRLVLQDYPDLLSRDQLVVTGLLGGEKIHVIVNHWPSRWGGAEQSSPLREGAAQLTRNIVDSLFVLDDDAKIIVMGDLNDDPMDVSVAQVLGAKKDARKVEDQELYNPMWRLLEKGVGTLAYKGKWNLFDQIIVSEEFLEQEAGELSFWKAEVFNKPFLTNQTGLYKGYPKRTHAGGAYLNGYSDHYPSLVYFVK